MPFQKHVMEVLSNAVCCSFKKLCALTKTDCPRANGLFFEHLPATLSHFFFLFTLQTSLLTCQKSKAKKGGMFIAPYNSGQVKLQNKMQPNAPQLHITAKKCFSSLVFLSCFQFKYLKILKSKSIFQTSKNCLVFRKK